MLRRVSVSRHFLSWDKPLLPQAVAWLAEGWDGKGPLDLSHLLVVVPTKQSGRRLREALAEWADARGQAARPPRVMTPDGLIAPAATAGVASRLQSLLAWVEIFRGLDPAAYREVFPIDPPARNFSWALRLAEQFLRLQAALGEGGLRLADVVDRAGDFPETARWRELGELERRHAEQLSALGLLDPAAAAIAAAEDPAPIAAEKIIVLAAPDPMPLALTALAAHARRVPVEIAVFAPASEAEAFDAWGRPLPAAWQRRELNLADFANRVGLNADPASQADRITALLGEYARSGGGRGAPSGRVGVGVADPEVLPLLEAALARAEFPVFNPEGATAEGRSAPSPAERPGFPCAGALLRGRGGAGPLPGFHRVPVRPRPR